MLTTSTRIASRSSRALVAQAVASKRYSSTMHDNDPNVLETEKRRNLNKEQHKTSTPHKHSPGWNEHLASASEAHVKADKSTGSPADLQRETVDYVKKRHSETEHPTIIKKTIHEESETVIKTNGDR